MEPGLQISWIGSGMLDLNQLWFNILVLTFRIQTDPIDDQVGLDQWENILDPKVMGLDQVHTEPGQDFLKMFKFLLLN